MSVTARVVIPHQPNPDDEWDYHQWYVTGERVKANVNGVSNPRMWSATWFKVVCNNALCPGWGLVHESVILDALEAVEDQ